MTTWILCADYNRAKVFRYDEAQSKIQCVDELAPDRLAKFFPAIAENVDRKLGIGTEARLILCGTPQVINHVCQCMSDRTREQIIGIVPEDITDEAPEVVCRCTRLSALPARATHTPYAAAKGSLW